jgi:hypothetical protein
MVYVLKLTCSCSAEEDPDEYPFPLTLRTKRPTTEEALEGIPGVGASTNGN